MPILIRLGARGDRARHHHRRGQHRALRRDVQFGQPDRVEPVFLGGIDLGHRLVECRLAAGGNRREFHEGAEFHRVTLFGLRATR